MKRTPITTILILFTAFFAMAFDRDDEENFSFYLSSYRTYTPGEDVTVSLNGYFSKQTPFTFTLYKINDPVGFFNDQPDPHSPGTAYDDSGNVRSTIDLKSTRYDKEKEWTEKLSGEEYWSYNDIHIPAREKGVYLIVAAARGQVATTVVIVSDAGLILKRSDDKVLGYAVDLRDGQKLPDARFTFRQDQKRVDVQTNADGIAEAKTKDLMATTSSDGDDEIYYSGNNLLAYGVHDGNFFISDSYYYGYWRGSADRETITYIHTDRPVYRPAQVVYYRGIVRTKDDQGMYESPTGGEVIVTISDARGGEMKSDTLTLSDLGTFHGELALAEEPPLGDYSIAITRDGASIGYGNFAVEEYKKPEYEVTVTTPKTSYAGGDEITATVNANYYFGSPVASGTVYYRILRSRYWIPWWHGSKWAYIYEGMPSSSPYYEEYIDGGEGELNPDGTFTFSFSAPSELDADYSYTLVADVTDANRRTISGSSTIRVTRGSFFLSAHTDRYVYKPGDVVTLKVTAQEFDADAPVATDFAVTVRRTWWEKDASNEKIIWNGKGKTGSDGTGEITFTATEAGYLTAEISATDSRGREITTAASVYVADKEYPWWDRSSGIVEIIPDKEMYEPGETMRALVIMPVDNADILITSEGPTIFNHRVERLSGNSAVITVPIEERFAPTFSIAVSTMVGSQVYRTEKQVVVTPKGKILTLEVLTDKSEYKPGEKGTITVRAVDETGKPVPNVDVAVSVVDEAIYAIRPDYTPDIATTFYGPRWNQVSTSTSLDFSFYNSSQRGELAEGRLSLTKSANGADGAGAPADAEMNAMDEGGLGGGDDYVAAQLRSDFRDLLFWTHSIRTDGSGRATIPVTFSDNLTTWRITARGVTHATQVGQSSAKVIARKNLLVRMETPRFITKGDKLLVATSIHNYLSTAKEVKVEFAAKGVTQKKKSTTITIPANGEQRVDWEVEATQIGAATFTVTALTNEESDAMELSIPVLPLGVMSGSSAVTDIAEPTGQRTMTLNVPANATLETATMKVHLSPSVAGSVLGALDELIGYPYGCVEQTMSRFLPTVVVAETLQELSIPFDQEKRDELPKMVEKGLQRLSMLQHDDGGWGWWENDETNPFMTAYVMYGFAIAREAGYAIPDSRFDQGKYALHYLIESFTAGGSLGNDRGNDAITTEAYMLYAASLLDEPENIPGFIQDRTRELAANEQINNYSIALLALASHAQENKNLAARLAERLVNGASETAAGATWNGKAWHYNWQDDNVETSAAAVKALLAIQGETELVRKGVRWLLAQKEGSSWHNTRRTAMVIYTMVDYLRSTTELSPDQTVTVKVNGKSVLTKKFTKADVFAEETVITIPAGTLKAGDNSVTIEKSGDGRVYASSRVTYFATGNAIKPAESGFAVTKEMWSLKRVMRDGAYFYEKEKITGPLKSGQEVFVKLTVTPDSRYEYFMMEDPIPAGAEVITDTKGYHIIGEDAYTHDDNDYDYWWRWDWWYADMDVRDEKVSFFATEIEPRTREMTYIMRAYIPGTYAVNPAVASLMYYPEVRGNSGAMSMTVVD